MLRLALSEARVFAGRVEGRRSRCRRRRDQTFGLGDRTGFSSNCRRRGGARSWGRGRGGDRLGHRVVPDREIGTSAGGGNAPHRKTREDQLIEIHAYPFSKARAG